MNEIGLKILEHASLVDINLKFNNFTGKELTEWMYPLASSITSEGAIPYLLETSNRFRASPLASAISWLDSAGLLPIDVLDKMQDALIMLKDNNIESDTDIGITKKNDDDICGWSLGEGVSVWSTSMAIISLLDNHNIGEKKSDKFKSAILWLADQRNHIEKGWAYQSIDNCVVNPIMTALAMRAISMSLSVLEYSPDEIKKLDEAVLLGFEYLKSTLSLSKGKAFWSFNNNPSCAATVWVLLALKQISTNGGTSIDNYKKFYNENKNKCLSFILSKIPAKSLKWEDELIVCEGGAKYNKQKNYFSYSATLIPQLISLGVSPYNPKIINQIKWLINNPDKWKISGYDKSTTCSFTYAMIISLLADWASKVGSENTAYLITSSKSTINNLVKYITGMPLIKKSPVQMVLKSRLIIFFVMIVMLIVLWGTDINETIHKTAAKIVSLWMQSSDDRHTIVVNIISNFIYAIIYAIIFFLLGKLFKKFFWKK